MCEPFNMNSMLSSDNTVEILEGTCEYDLGFAEIKSQEVIESPELDSCNVPPHCDT